MKAYEACERLMVESEMKPLTLKTKRGLHFSIVSNKGMLIVHSSNIEPSSKLKMPRSISKDNFAKAYPYYLRWKMVRKGLAQK